MKVRCTAAALFCMIGVLATKAETQDGAKARLKLGAYYFAGWAGKSHFDDGKPEHAWTKGMPTHFTKKLPNEFVDRTPIWGWRDDTPELMERQIDLAVERDRRGRLACAVQTRPHRDVS